MPRWQAVVDGAAARRIRHGATVITSLIKLTIRHLPDRRWEGLDPLDKCRRSSIVAVDKAEKSSLSANLLNASGVQPKQ
jgi:hypothetical protein